jgi:transposase
VEATTGWRFVAEELERIGARVHLAEPAETAARRGPKRRAKTDRLDARLLRELLRAGRLPESWIPPAHILDLRSRVRLRKAPMDERSGWQRRIHACLFHESAARVRELLSGEGRAALARVALPGAGAARDGVADDRGRVSDFLCKWVRVVGLRSGF